MFYRSECLCFRCSVYITTNLLTIFASWTPRRIWQRLLVCKSKFTIRAEVWDGNRFVLVNWCGCVWEDSRETLNVHKSTIHYKTPDASICLSPICAHPFSQPELQSRLFTPRRCSWHGVSPVYCLPVIIKPTHVLFPPCINLWNHIRSLRHPQRHQRDLNNIVTSHHLAAHGDHWYHRLNFSFIEQLICSEAILLLL